MHHLLPLPSCAVQQSILDKIPSAAYELDSAGQDCLASYLDARFSTLPSLSLSASDFQKAESARTSRIENTLKAYKEITGYINEKLSRDAFQGNDIFDSDKPRPNISWPKNPTDAEIFRTIFNKFRGRRRESFEGYI